MIKQFFVITYLFNSFKDEYFWGKVKIGQIEPLTEPTLPLPALEELLEICKINVNHLILSVQERTLIYQKRALKKIGYLMLLATFTALPLTLVYSKFNDRKFTLKNFGERWLEEMLPCTVTLFLIRLYSRCQHLKIPAVEYELLCILKKHLKELNILYDTHFELNLKPENNIQNLKNINDQLQLILRLEEAKDLYQEKIINTILFIDKAGFFKSYSSARTPEPILSAFCEYANFKFTHKF